MNIKITKTEIETACKVFGVFVAILIAVSCKKTNTPTPKLTLSNMTSSLPNNGGTVTLAFTSSASWSIDTTGIGWLHLSQSSGGSGAASINLTAAANSSGVSRSVLLTVKSADGQMRRVTVSQSPQIYPSYNTSPIAPDATGMGSTAIQLAANIKLAWNLFNTFEAHNSETSWGQPYTTQAEIDMVKNAGFDAIRLPCAWHIHMNPATGVIDPVWLARVKQVVQYCINDKLYVVLNCHADDGFLDCGATGALQDTIKAIQKAIWEQVATTMRDFDEHLMFASANEPADAQWISGPKDGTPHGVSTLQAETALEQYHQIFIDAVRSTGGKNAYRTLVIQSLNTSDQLLNAYLPGGIPGMPKDPVANKLAFEFHFYSPPNFCILSSDVSWGHEWCFWGKNFHTTNPALLIRNAQPGTEEDYMDAALKNINKLYVSKNIPVIIGEYDAAGHDATMKGYGADSILSRRSQEHFRAQMVRTGLKYGVRPFLWASGVFDRANNKVGDQPLLDSLVKAAAGN